MDVIDRIVPSEGPCRTLEVGCGSGVTIRRACQRNAELRAVGLEGPDGVVHTTGLRHRVVVGARPVEEEPEDTANPDTGGLDSGGQGDDTGSRTGPTLGGSCGCSAAGRSSALAWLLAMLGAAVSRHRAH